MKLHRVVALLAALSTAAPAVASADVQLRGTAYEFNNTDVRLGGAKIRVAEDPRLGATTRADGTYALTVPEGRRVTPYIVKPGYHTIHLQTFAPGGEDLERVNFQTPTDGVYQALAALLGVPVGPDGNPTECAMVSTFSTRMVRDLPFERFTAFGAHGVEGATASGTPALPAPVYFNDKVIPDRGQARSSIDGGVVWTGVKAGVYTVRARHASRDFAPFTATCAPGRVVNANPPWGLHELGLANPAKAAADGRLIRLPKKATVRVGGRTLRPSGTRLDLGARLRPGRTVEALVRAQGYDSTLFRWRVAANGRAKVTKRCVPLGWTAPRRTCSVD